MLLRPTVKEMHLQENTKYSSVPSTSWELCTCIVWSCYVQRFGRRCIYKKIHYTASDHDLGFKVTQNVAKYPLHHVTYAITNFEVATSNGLEGDTFTQKYIYTNLTFDLDFGVNWHGQGKHCPVPSTSCDLCSYKICKLLGDPFTRNVMHGGIDRRTMDRLWYEINIPFFF